MEESKLHIEEKLIEGKNGLIFLIQNTLLVLISIFLFIMGIIMVDNNSSVFYGVILIVLGSLFGFIVGPIMYAGLKVIKPNEALVLTLFGKYYGTIRKEGFFYVNPFVTAVNPTKPTLTSQAIGVNQIPTNSAQVKSETHKFRDNASGKCISLKALTLNNNKQKVNDKLGNPIEIGVVVIWKVVNSAKAVFNVDNYMEFLSIQADSALRNIVRLYPYDISNDDDNDDELSLRGSSQEVALKLQKELQEKVEIAGIEILETRITHLAYAPEIAAAMLQRQQASAIIDARKLIVEGAVGMVEMALNQLNENNIVQLDDERRAAMVSNLLVVLCGNKDAQPIVNSGSIY
ncbi:MAG TPA: hypothetical protein DC000_08675 [Clostridiales bacterium]|nr:hypothetical protein [Clostridiales bacterium]